jgi:2-phosphoglycerate kinase
MAKLLVENPEEETQVPFLRGILIRSLQDAGLAFDDALKLANDIREEFSNVSHVTTDALSDKVVKRLTKSDIPNLAVRYQRRKNPTFIRVKDSDGQYSAFSRTRYRYSLETIGLKQDEAMDIADAVSSRLMKRESGEVTSKYIAAFTYRLLRKSRKLGPAVAHRWLVWRDFVHSDKPLIFLIGGTAGCGKSTVASDLASRLNIVRTQSADMLREVMRTLVPKHLQPMLHVSSFEAWAELPRGANDKADAEQLLIDGYCSQAELLTVAISAVTRRALKEHVSLIVEGVHIHPAFLDRLVDTELARQSEAVIVPVMLGIIKRKRLLRRIAGRSSEAPQRCVKPYLRNFDNIWKLQSYLLSEADMARVPIIANEEREDVFREIMLMVIEKLSEGFDKTPEQVFSSATLQ